MDKSSLEALIRWLEIWSAIFGVVVVVGVAGESFFGIRLLWNNWKLQRLQIVENETLRAEVARAQADAAKAALELEKFKVPRWIVGSQKDEIVKELRPLGSHRVEVFSLIQQSEVLWLGIRIVAVLNEAGWTARSISNPHLPSIIVVPGIAIEFPEKCAVETRQAAYALASALRNVDLQVSGPWPSRGMVRNAPIEVFIGSKP